MLCDIGPLTWQTCGMDFSNHLPCCPRLVAVYWASCLCKAITTLVPLLSPGSADFTGVGEDVTTT